jgi:DNA polymerase-3 subunit delta'
MSNYKLKISDYIDMMMMWYRDILMLKVTGNPGRLMFKEYYSDIKKQSAQISYEGIENVLKAMDKAKIRLEANVSFEVTAELMLLTMKENR